MARRAATPRLQPSLWDRLVDPDLATGAAAAVSASGELARFRDQVRRDLEWLLNSRRPPVDLPPGMTRLGKSLMSYGLPDFTSMNLADPSEADRLLRVLEAVIRDFEPRLTNVRITLNPPSRDSPRAALHYRIEALLRVDPAPEPVAFDTVLELSNRAFVVQSDGARALGVRKAGAEGGGRRTKSGKRKTKGGRQRIKSGGRRIASQG